MKNKILIITLIAFAVSLAGCSAVSKVTEKENGKTSQAESRNKKKALQIFLEGNTLEAKGALAEAILDYQEALRYDTSSGIYYALAKNYFRLNKLLPAMENIRKALALDSTNVEYYQLLGDIYSFSHNNDSAAAVYKKIIGMDSTNVRAYFLLGELYEYEKPLEALKMFKKLLKIAGPDWNVLLKIAEINERIGKIDDTINTIEKLLDVNPANLKVQKVLIDSYIKNKQYDKALKLTDDALLTFPNDLALIEYKANIYFKQGKYSESAKWYEKLIESKKISYKAKLRIASMFLNKTNENKDVLNLAEGMLLKTAKDSSGWEVNAYLAEVELEKKNDSLAISYFKKAIKDAQWNSQLWSRFANVLFMSEKYDEVTSEITPALKNFPDNFFLNLIVGLAYSQMSENAEAKKYLMKAVELDPNDVTALTALGFTLNQLNETDAAIVYLERALKIEPKNIQALGTLGLIYDNEKNYKKCDEVYEKAIALDSTNALLLNNYAYSLSERGIQLERAYEMSRKSLLLEPDNPSYLDTFGWILYKMNKPDSAKIFIEKAIRKEKNNATILEHLGDVYFKLNNKKAALKYWNKAYLQDKTNKSLKKKIEENKF